jgi:hypothetical protein
MDGAEERIPSDDDVVVTRRRKRDAKLRALTFSPFVSTAAADDACIRIPLVVRI